MAALVALSRLGVSTEVAGACSVQGPLLTLPTRTGMAFPLLITVRSTVLPGSLLSGKCTEKPASD